MQENRSRSFVKGITWRSVGTMDTIFLSWLFTGEISTALHIGGVEIFTKIILFYIHERIWLMIGFGRFNIDDEFGNRIRKDRHYRSVVKGVSWRLFGTIDTAVIAFFVTGNYTTAFSIGFAEIFTKVVLYYLHERVWSRIKIGSKPDDTIKSEQR